MKKLLSAMLQAGMSLGLLACIKDDEVKYEIVSDSNKNAENDTKKANDIKVVSELLDQIA